MSPKALVLLSGGLDSTVNLYQAHREWNGELMALSFDYGQKAFRKEAQAAEFFCGHLRIPHRIISLRDIFSWDQSSLTSREKEVPTNEVDISSAVASEKTAKSVWVANRNGVFLNIAACVAESLGAGVVIPGFNKEEAETFPDNSKDYIQALNQSFAFSTSNKVQVQCFTQDWDKAQIYKRAVELDIPIDKIWPCYHGGETLCGRCESCQRFQRAREALS